jgi:serine/threonine-protein kinase RsbW
MPKTKAFSTITVWLPTDIQAAKFEDYWPLQPLQRAFLQVNTDLNALAEVLLWFDQFKGPPLPDRDWLQCQLLLAEAFTNAVRHAHKGRPVELLIDMEVMLLPEQIEIRLWDWGDPFNLTQSLARRSVVLEPEAEGGRGLQLMQKLADVVSYTRLDHRNCLLIVKYYTQSQIKPE